MPKFGQVLGTESENLSVWRRLNISGGEVGQKFQLRNF